MSTKHKTKQKLKAIYDKQKIYIATNKNSFINCFSHHTLSILFH